MARVPWSGLIAAVRREYSSPVPTLMAASGGCSRPAPSQRVTDSWAPRQVNTWIVLGIEREGGADQAKPAYSWVGLGMLRPSSCSVRRSPATAGAEEAGSPRLLDCSRSQMAIRSS